MIPLQKYIGEIDLAKSKQNAIVEIEKGLPILYRIRLPTQNPLAKLAAIYINGQLFCESPKGSKFIFTHESPSWKIFWISENAVTNYFLEYAFSIPKSSPISIRKGKAVEELNQVCGITEYAATITGLVVGGQSASRGQFPW